MTQVLGVDGWRGSWVAAHVETQERGQPTARLIAWHTGPFAEVVADAQYRVIGVDMPVGLPERGQRRADLSARTALRPAGSRVFAVPARDAWEAPNLSAANDVLRAAGEPGMSAQAFALKSAIVEVAAHDADRRIVEVHPELAFLELVGLVLPPKKTAQGVAARIAALAPWIDVVEALSTAPARVPVDDALDALAAAWTAVRVADGTARSYPADGGDPDRVGRLMRIYA